MNFLLPGMATLVMCSTPPLLRKHYATFFLSSLRSHNLLHLQSCGLEIWCHMTTFGSSHSGHIKCLMVTECFIASCSVEAKGLSGMHCSSDHMTYGGRITTWHTWWGNKSTWQPAAARLYPCAEGGGGGGGSFYE